ATAVDEIRAEHFVAFADEGIRAVPLIHAEIDIEAVRDAVPGHLPAHSRLEASDVLLRRARREHERCIASVQVGEMGDLVGHERAAAARLFGPAVHAGLEKSAVDDQLTPAVEQVEQAGVALRSVELVRLFHRLPWHPPTLSRPLAPRVRQSLLLKQKQALSDIP